MNLFQFRWNPIIKFFNESKTLYMMVDYLLILVFLTFLQPLTQLHDNPIRLWLWFGHHQLHLADLNVLHLWVKNPRHGIYQTNFDTVCLFLTIHITKLFSSLFCVLSFTETKKQNMTKMLVFRLHLKVNAKLITVNKITRNLLVKQAESDS